MSKVELFHGDCLDLMKDIPDGSVDCIITDSPYGTTNCKWDKVPDLKLFFDHGFRVLKANGALISFSQLPFAVDMINACRKYFRYEIIWNKTKAVGFLNANKMPLRAHENILVFYRKLPVYNPQKTKGAPYKTKHGGGLLLIYTDIKILVKQIISLVTDILMMFLYSKPLITTLCTPHKSLSS